MPTTCTHLDQIKNVEPTSTGCEECLEGGGQLGALACLHDMRPRRLLRRVEKSPCLCPLPHLQATPSCALSSPARIGCGATTTRCLSTHTHCPVNPVEVEQASTKEFLRPLPLFASLEEQDLDTLTRLAEPRAIKAGDLLMEQGSPGNALYVVLDGQFEVTKRSGKHDVVLGLRGSGEMLGEMALMEEGPADGLRACHPR